MSADTTATTEPLLTADEFMRRHGSETRVELFRGRIVRYPMPGGPHGYIISRVNAKLFNFAEANRLGRVFANDTFVRVRLTEPTDTVRGADVAFVSFAKLPEGDIPEGPLPVPPELVVEVRSPSDRISQLSAKAAEYLDAGVAVVIVIDPQTESLAVYREDELPVRMHNGDELTLPDVLPGFAVKVSEFFR
jgi:Uma2 family endonuclease